MRRTERRARSPALGSIIIIGGIMMMIVALIGVAVSFSGVVETTYMSLALETPGFDYSVEAERNDIPRSEMFEAFVLMRYVAMGVFAAVLIVAAVSKVLEASETGMIRPGTGTAMISQSLLFLIIIAIFPPVWDIMTDIITNVSLWVLNPMYSFDPENPCPEHMTDQQIQDAYFDSPYVRYSGAPPEEQEGPQGRRSDSAVGRPTEDVLIQRYSAVCQPELKVRYVFSQMLRATEDSDSRLDTYIRNNVTESTGLGEITGETSWMGNVQNSIVRGSEGVFTNLFLGLTKALVAIQVLIMALMIGIMTDMLAAMIAAALPVFLMLSLLPKIGDFANMMIKALPSLLLLPLMSAIIIVIGAGAIVESGGGEGAYGTIYTWISSVGVVFFAVTLPVLMVPMLGQVTQMATTIVSSAVMSGSIIAAQGAAGAATAARDANRGGAGLAGIMRGFMAGGLASGLAAHGSVSAPGFAGAPQIGAAPLAGAVSSGAGIGHGIDPEAAAMPPLKEQRLAASEKLDGIMLQGQTAQNADPLLKEGVIGAGWDPKVGDDVNVERIGRDINKFEDELSDAGRSLSGAQKEAVRNWRGLFQTVAMDPTASSGEVLTMTKGGYQDVDFSKISDKALMGEINKRRPPGSDLSK